MMGLSVAVAQPVLAHQTETSEDIGVTLHIEPNDIPRAGEPSLTWFALTRRGGAIVPLASCDCVLTVQTVPDGQIVDEPPLEAVSAEGYDGIPGALITFPQIGAYELVLEGRPTTPDDFIPFEFQFDVTVATGASISPSTETPDSASEEIDTESAAVDDSGVGDLAEQQANASQENSVDTSSGDQQLSPETVAGPVIWAAVVGGILVAAIALWKFMQLNRSQQNN
ncbi:MAG: hypothetical protein AAFU78_00465 [Cyanobacteria bacterium J06633_2]